ncbi:hypothetical protein FACS189499_09590 [Clostridia bacterium]|nr:hypothetical protein FACS189499_09590 [Clostridia bacterium]
MNHKPALVATILSLAIILSACAKDPVPPQVETTEITSIATTQTETQTETQPAPDEYPETVIIREPTEDNPLQFDFDEALNNIYIGNKKMSFPETLADLGEGFSFEGRPLESMPSEDISSHVTVIDGVMYDGKKIGEVFVIDNEKDYDENSKIIEFYLDINNGNRNLKDFYSMQGIYKFRIGQKLTKQEVKNYFGEPTSEGKMGLKYVDDERFISFTIDEADDESLHWIRLSIG